MWYFWHIDLIPVNSLGGNELVFKLKKLHLFEEWNHKLVMLKTGGEICCFFQEGNISRWSLLLLILSVCFCCNTSAFYFFLESSFLCRNVSKANPTSWFCPGSLLCTNVPQSAVKPNLLAAWLRPLMASNAAHYSAKHFEHLWRSQEVLSLDFLTAMMIIFIPGFLKRSCCASGTQESQLKLTTEKVHIMWMCNGIHDQNFNFLYMFSYYSPVLHH